MRDKERREGAAIVAAGSRFTTATVTTTGDVGKDLRDLIESLVKADGALRPYEAAEITRKALLYIRAAGLRTRAAEVQAMVGAASERRAGLASGAAGGSGGDIPAGLHPSPPPPAPAPPPPARPAPR